MSYKLVLIVRNDLKMSKGKIAAQVGHAVVDATIAAIENGKLCKWQKSKLTRRVFCVWCFVFRALSHRFIII